MVIALSSAAPWLKKRSCSFLTLLASPQRPFGASAAAEHHDPRPVPAARLPPEMEGLGQAGRAGTKGGSAQGTAAGG